MNHQLHVLCVRRQMLHDWAAAWYARYERDLASEGVRFPVRVGHGTYTVTSEQALVAVSRTVHELDRRLGDHALWGCDRQGRPSELAMRGLINRRLTSRLIDQLRRSDVPDTSSLSQPIGQSPEATIVLEDTLSGPSPVTQVETTIWLTQILASEPPATREIVMRRALGEPSTAIADHLGLADAATRQRLNRFKRRHCSDLMDAVR